jgi:hypothetical protein
MAIKTQPLFELGEIVSTRGALGLMRELSVAPVDLLSRHVCGDWGELDEQDKRENDFSLTNRLRIFSAYTYGDKKFWVITEADRSATTILLPSEY